MSGERIKDKTRKAIIADRACGESIRAIAKKYAVSTTSVQRIIQESPELTQLVTQKKAENTADILAYMESKRGVVCEIIEKGLAALNSAEKLEDASPVQITTALGTLIDKWATVTGGPADKVREDGLSKSLREMAEGLESDD